MKKDIFERKEIDIDELSVEQAIRVLERYKWLNATIDMEYTVYWVSDIYIEYNRKETNDEYTERLKLEQAKKEKDLLRQKNKIEKEKELYEKLKIKYWKQD